MLTVAEAEFGGMPLAALDDPRVRKDFLDWRQAIAGTSGAREADNRLSAISAMEDGWKNGEPVDRIAHAKLVKAQHHALNAVDGDAG